MDPNRALKDFTEALRELAQDPSNEAAREQAVEAARNLADWLEKGGFPPALGPREEPQNPAPKPSPWDYAWRIPAEDLGKPDFIWRPDPAE